jgi:hypothetical protein
MIDIKINLSIVLPGRIKLSKQECLENPKNKYKTAKQSLNISKEGYLSMISNKEIPYWSNAKNWSRLNTKERLEQHLQKICESLGGITYSYKIFDE